jgi:hypothetical protein
MIHSFLIILEEYFCFCQFSAVLDHLNELRVLVFDIALFKYYRMDIGLLPKQLQIFNLFQLFLSFTLSDSTPFG